MHRPGIEPGPPAWQARILPLNHRCSLQCNHFAFLAGENCKWIEVFLITVKSFCTYASAGNRTRASRVAGENSTTEPPMLLVMLSLCPSLVSGLRCF